MAICERVLRVRMEVRDAVAAKLRQVTPDKIEQFELLLQDHRSVRKLADETLNDETVVTAENAEQLFEAMRKATVAEERLEYERNLQKQKARHLESQRKSRAETNRAVAAAQQSAKERDAAKAALAARKTADRSTADGFALKISTRAKRIEHFATVVLLGMGALAVVQYFTGWLTTSRLWTLLLAVAGVIGLYDFITNRLERPKIGVPTLLRLYCRWSLNRLLKAANLPEQSVDDFDFDGCKITRKDR